VSEQENGFEGWAILELMGHRRLAGWLSQETVAGAPFVRIDVPADDPAALEPSATQFYAPSAVYCITPTTEETARAVARGARPTPVQRWELPPPPAPRSEESGMSALRSIGRSLGPDDDFALTDDDDDVGSFGDGMEDLEDDEELRTL